jgi:uncharacterized protein (UPF0548 family)
MMLLRKSDADRVRAFVGVQSSLPFNYPNVGATSGDLPAGYHTDHVRLRLGGERQTAAQEEVT